MRPKAPRNLFTLGAWSADSDSSAPKNGADRELEAERLGVGSESADLDVIDLSAFDAADLFRADADTFGQLFGRDPEILAEASAPVSVPCSFRAHDQ